MIWITNTGEKILVNNMDTQHIINCVLCIKDKRISSIKDHEDEWIKIFLDELIKRDNADVFPQVKEVMQYYPPGIMCDLY